MSQPTPQQQRYIYYVIYSWPNGTGAMELNSVGAFTTFEHVTAATEFIQQRHRPGHRDIVITNWILLRVEPVTA
jgi:hypothetical protein